MGALKGIRIVDFTRVLAGPYCTMMLADLGADVVKVESVVGGDETRGWGPPHFVEESAYYLCANRNKRGIAVDLKQDGASVIVEKLVAEADVVIHNFLPKSAQRLGLSYERAKRLREDVIYCAISGYGAGDKRPGYDYMLQAVGGLMSITGETAGRPVKVGVAVTDLFTGQFAAISILAALRHRDATGQGQAIDMALYDAQIAMLANVASNVIVSGNDAKRYGNEHANIVPYQAFETADGYVVITVGNDHQYQAFCQAFDFADLAVDPRFASNAQRVRNRSVLIPALEARLRLWKTSDILSKLAATGVPCGEVKSVQAALTAKETAERELIWQVPDGRLAGLHMVGSPLKLLETPPELHRAPPGHGEHTVEVLQELGFADESIENWMKEGVITCSTSH